MSCAKSFTFPSFSFHSSHSSLWWRDIMNIGRGYLRDPIVEGCSFVVRNRYHTLFWEANRWGGGILKDVFSDVYEASCLKGVSVALMGGWVEGNWKWGDFGISREKEAERGLSASMRWLKKLVADFIGVWEGRDVVSWKFNWEGVFSVASCYTFLGLAVIPFGPPNEFEDAFGLVWKAEVPFKIKAFGRRLLLDRIPTKDLLVYRGISFPLDKLNCSLFGYEVENRNNSFLGCRVVKAIWLDIALWVGKEGDMEDRCLSNFMDWHRFFKDKKVKKK
ncbi:uncharacterized protein LOC131659106 [Vicia villosa]|uniref:uncharacterized protein LOC131659106 n=1 Tax=Vicia villosa TaxID=3911 RepID=UPI00273ABE31|nr:uncharacterized protein LOC131659106 [Vicia villosa]